VASIVFDHITKRYSDGFEAVKDMSLTVADGEFMILVGPSGSGKSTALRMVAGLEDITEGELRIGNEVVNDRTPKDRDIAMVFQNYALYPHMTVRQNMGFALTLAGLPADEVDRRVSAAAATLQLEPHLDRKPGSLSGGQRQRVAMGRAIVRRPQAFLMDEPLSNLDAKLRVQTRAEISRIQQRVHTTTIYVTHDQTEAMTLGDRIAVMRAGRLAQVGSSGELYAEPVDVFVAGFIGSPAMNFLPGSIDGNALHTAIGDVEVTAALRQRLTAGPGGGEGGVIVGLRPEDFDDAALVGHRGDGHTFTSRIDLLEPLGSELDAHFTVQAPHVASKELDELAQDSGTAELWRSSGGVSLVARLDRDSRVAQGEEAELWFDSSRLYLFDADSGRSLLGRGARRRSAAGVS
jgi:multiple sugar transport system ATP-binding protein